MGTVHVLDIHTLSKDREIMKTPRESIVIADTDVDYPTVVSTKSAQVQVAVKGDGRLRDTGDHNRWKNSVLTAGLDLFGAQTPITSSTASIPTKIFMNMLIVFFW